MDPLYINMCVPLTFDLLCYRMLLTNSEQYTLLKRWADYLVNNTLFPNSDQ